MEMIKEAQRNIAEALASLVKDGELTKAEVNEIVVAIANANDYGNFIYGKTDDSDTFEGMYVVNNEDEFSQARDFAKYDSTVDTFKCGYSTDTMEFYWFHAYQDSDDYLSRNGRGEDSWHYHYVIYKKEIKTREEDVKMNTKAMMIKEVWRALDRKDTVSVLGDTKYEAITFDNYNDFVKDASEGRYDECRIDLGYDDDQEVPELIVAFLGLNINNNNEGEKEMNNNTEVKVTNKTEERKDDVKMMNTIIGGNMAPEQAERLMETKRKMGEAFVKYANETQKARRVPSLVININGENAQETVIDFTNYTVVLADLAAGKFSELHTDAKDNMFFRYKATKTAFVVKLSPIKANAEVKEVILPTATTPTIVPVEEVKTPVDTKVEHVQIDSNVVVEDHIEAAFPNPYIVSQATSASNERYAELAAKAPRTGIENAKVFMDAVAKKVVADHVGFRNAARIETKHMNFFDVKQLQKDGTGREYKQVASPWLFKLLNISNFIILSNVPNKDTLRYIMENGIIANVVVGQEIVEYAEDGTPIKQDIMEEKLFKYVASSASKQRQERYIFTSYEDRENIRKMLVFWSEEFNFGKEAAVAKSESRVGQNLSTGVCIGGAVPYAKRQQYLRSEYAKYIEFTYMVIEDMTVAEFKRLRGEEVLPGDEDKVLADGSGFHTEAAGNKAKKKLRNPQAMILQHRLGKGTTYQVSNEFIMEFAKNRGIEVDPTLPIIFVSRSMWKFQPGIDLLPFIVLRSSEEMSQYAAMCYETWNALNISGPNGLKTLETLAKREYDMFHLTEKSDAGLIMHRLGTIAKLDDMEEDLMEDKTLATSLFRLFMANPFFARRSEYLMRQVRMLFARKIADMARGKILVNGSFCIMMLDPGIWTGKTLLKKGQVYAGGKVGKCLMARYPMVYMGEPQVMEAVDLPEFAAFKGLNIIIMNPFDFAWERMQGADFDGDACLVTFEESVIELAVSNQVPEAPDMEKKEAKKAVLGWDAISDYFVKNFEIMHPEDPTYVATIGKTNNIVAALLSAAHANGTFLADVTIKRVQHLGVTINDLIDAAKTGVMPELEKFFFDTYKLLPNWLAKPKKNPLNKREFINTWEVATVEQDPESIYYMDTKSPLGILCNKIVPELYKKFIVAGDRPFKVDDFVGMYDGTISSAVQSQINGIKSEYVARSRYIFGTDNNMTDDERTEAYKALCSVTTDRIKKVAASFNNDIYTVGIACLIAGGAAGFAFKCFEEGVIAVFEKMEGVTMFKANSTKEVPEGAVAVEYENVKYYAIKRASKEVQFNKLVAADLEKELTLRLVGLQYHGVKSMDDLKAKVFAANNIIVGGKDTNGFYVAMANGKSIGKVTLDGTFAAMSSFVQGGMAEVVDVRFVRNNAEQAMSYAEFMASKKGDAIIKSADLVVKYVAPKNDGDNTPSSPTAMQESTLGLADELPMMGAVDNSTVSCIGDDQVVDLNDALLYGAGLASTMGMEIIEEKVQPVADKTDVMPDPEFASLFATCPDFACDVEPDHMYVNNAPIDYKAKLNEMGKDSFAKSQAGIVNGVKMAIQYGSDTCKNCVIACDGKGCFRVK